MSTWKLPEPRPAWARATAAFCLALTFLHPVSAGETSAARIRRHVTTLASDAFEGRAPGTAGETRTVSYLAEQFSALGLTPGNPDGTFFQDVPLVGITSDITVTLTVGGETLVPRPVYDISGESRRVTPRIEVPDTEIVFVGYGISAPEYGWDDYKGLDLRGKTLVMLINDPPVVTDEGSLDERMFRGRAMTYYGRWTYKYEMAARLGAAACLIVHETGPAGYPFAVVGASAGREQFDLRTEDGNRDRAAVEAWMTWDFSKRLFAAAGLDLATLKAAAARPDFRPVVLPAQARYSVQNTLRDVRSRNVAALLPGRDPSLNEYVVLTSHWDHLGRDPRLEGDQIFNGATDNASGTAILLDVAARLAALPPAERPRRNLLFLSVTAEEMGLLGAKHYAANPLYPLARTVANVNLDGANHLAPTRDIEVIGWGATTIEDIAAGVAQALGRTLTPDTQPEKGSYFRSDHFEFAKAGVPAFYSKAGRQPIDRPADYIDQKRAEYVSRHYHKVSDEVTEDWDFNATAQDSDFLFGLSRKLGDAADWPRWREGSEFKARRDAMLR